MVEVESQFLPENRFFDSPDGAENASIVHRVLAASSNDELYFSAGHEVKLIRNDWRKEPFNIEIWLQNENVTEYRSFNRLAEFAKLSLKSPIPATIASDPVFLFLPVWPLRNFSAPRHDSPSMILIVKAALDSGTYKATLKRDLIGGQWCNEISSSDGNDRIWLAEDKDLCIMRREWFHPKTKMKMGEIIIRRVAEVGPGLWMPVEVEDVTYSSSSRLQNAPVLKSRVLTRVTNWKSGGEVPIDIFQPRLKPGSIELIEPGKFRQLSPGGTEHMDEMAIFFRGTSGFPQQPPAAERLLYNMPLVVAGGLVGMILFHLCRKSYALTHSVAGAVRKSRSSRGMKPKNLSLF